MSKDRLAQEKSCAFEHPTNNTVVPFPRSRGWVRLSREELYDPIVGAGQKAVKPANANKPAFSPFEAWCWLKANATWQPKRVDNKGTLITLQRGQLMASYSFLACEWNWSEKTARGFLEGLERNNRISRSMAKNEGKQKGNLIQVITITNYNENWDAEPVLGQAARQADAAWRASKGQDYKKGTTKKSKEQSPCSPPQEAGDKDEASLVRQGEESHSSATSAADKRPRRVRDLTDEQRGSGGALINAFNEIAAEHGFPAAQVTPDSLLRAAQLAADIGGPEMFRRALSKVPEDDFLMGRVRSLDGRAPFELRLDYLFSPKGRIKLGELLDKVTSDQVESRFSPREEIWRSKKAKKPVVILGRDLNAILASSDTLTVGDLQAAIAKGIYEYGSSTFQEILAKVTRFAERVSLVRRYGPPEQFSGGVVAMLDGEEMRADLACLNQKWLTGVLDRYPGVLGIRWGDGIYDTRGQTLLAQIYLLLHDADLTLYARGELQKHVEARIEEFIAKQWRDTNPQKLVR